MTGFYFFKTNKNIQVNLKNYKLFFEVPENLKIRSAVVVTGWTQGKKIYEFETSRGTDENSIRYSIPLPQSEIGTVFNVNDMVGYTGFHSLLFIEPSGKGKIPEEFSAKWYMEGPSGKISGEQLFTALPFVPAKKLPKDFEVWAEAGTKFLDKAENEDRIDLYSGMGIKFAGIPEHCKYFTDCEETWLKKGFHLYSGELQKFIFKYDLPLMEAPVKPEQCFVGLDGKSVFGTKNYRNTPWCPAQFYNQSSPLFSKSLAYVRDMYKAGVKDFYSDHELDIYLYCYCDTCLNDFSKFSGIPFEKLKSMPPMQIASENLESWYKFRCQQSGKMCEALRNAMPDAGDIRFGINSVNCYFDAKHGSLGWGRSLFADDWRFVDPFVDFHNIDTLCGSISDPVQLDLIIKEVKKPVIVRTYSNYCFGWEFPHCSTRFEKAKKEGIKMGYDQRPEMQMLSILSIAATGGRGVELLIGNSSFDAKVVNSIAKAIEITASHEDFWLSGKRCENKFKVFLISPKNSSYLKDDSLISGRIWAKFFFRQYGPLLYRMHELNGSYTISVFNWDALEKQKLMIIPPTATGEKVYISEIDTGISYLTSSGSETWSAEDLKAGIVIENNPLGFTILTITQAKPDSCRTSIKALPSEKTTDAPYDPYHYLKNSEHTYNLKKALELNNELMENIKKKNPVK